MAETDTFVAGVQSLTESARTAINNPADQIRLLATLASYQVPAVSGTSPLTVARQTAQAATAAMCRRAALSSLARACASYAPTSANDAQAVLNLVLPLFDAEIEDAADQGDLQSYSSLRALRSSVATDLQTRGSSLPELVTITRRAALPSLVIAWQLYEDATRSDELIARVNPVHPGYMPLTFQALSF